MSNQLKIVRWFEAGNTQGAVYMFNGRRGCSFLGHIEHSKRDLCNILRVSLGGESNGGATTLAAAERVAPVVEVAPAPKTMPRWDGATQRQIAYAMDLVNRYLAEWPTLIASRKFAQAPSYEQVAALTKSQCSTFIDDLQICY